MFPGRSDVQRLPSAPRPQVVPLSQRVLLESNSTWVLVFLLCKRSEVQFWLIIKPASRFPGCAVNSQIPDIFCNCNLLRQCDMLGLDCTCSCDTVNTTARQNKKAPACYHQRGSADNQHLTVSVARELGMPPLRKPNSTGEQIWIWLSNVKLSCSVLRFRYIHRQNIKAIQKFTSTQGKLPQNKWIRNQVNWMSHWVNQSSLTFISTKYLKEKTG